LNSNKIESSSSYKIFSKAVCNFAFPNEIKRPFPKTRAVFLNELDTKSYSNLRKEPLTKESLSKLKVIQYEADVDKALDSLEVNKNRYLKLDKGLLKYSPKFNKMIHNLNSIEGTSLIYSDFRKVEGLKTLGISLEANGWSELKITFSKDGIDVLFDNNAKYFYAKFGDSGEKTKKEANNILLNIFNNDLNELPGNILKKIMNVNKSNQSEGNLNGRLLKAMMITKSGSEGISLKNVRRVHILEPYWNNIRLDQVIGRAIRTGSHLNLPLSKRNVQVFYYMSTMNEEQSKTTTQLIKSTDKGKTSDELVKDIADRKTKIIAGFLKNLKEASIDCRVHSKAHEGKNLECFDFGSSVDVNKNSFTFDINEDFIEKSVFETESHSAENISIVRFPTIEKVSNKKFIYIQSANSLYDLSLYDNMNMLKQLGTMTEIEESNYLVTLTL
jgi:hypothetical protein